MSGRDGTTEGSCYNLLITRALEDGGNWKAGR